MTNLAEGRRLATKLGYINEDGSPGPRWGSIYAARQQDLRAIAGVMPEVIVGQATPPERRAEYVAAGFTLVEFDEPNRPAQIRTDPVTGHREYIAAREPYVYAAATSTSGGPPSVFEPAPEWTRIHGIELDRYAANPLVDYYRQTMPGAQFVGATPAMFLHGDYPIVTSSGVPVAILRWVPFWARHEAACTTSQARLYALIEEADTGSFDLLTDVGRKGWDDYRSRVETWVLTPPPRREPTLEEIGRLYGPGPADTGE